MEDVLANLRLVDDEEEAIQEDVAIVENFPQFCLVGRCLTDSVVHFPSLRNTMADLWHPIGGICITDIGENDIYSNFFIKSTLISYGDNPAVLELNSTEFWVQVHDLPPGLMSESMAIQLGNFCGKFIEYESNNPLLGQKSYMRIRWENNWRTWEEDGSVSIGLGKGPMDFALEEENDPIGIMEGKKRQRVVEGQIDCLGPKVGPGSMDISASSREQSNLAQ
ncbi:hypothetical protein Goklo_029003 [Gossypium klotzschianum]|uniref:DUF4283 domain-containing protein n=1 Tax=Gossypium klotzschianum TaxID=34286 RepID=A0A7J8WC08_9ROSI|nr:hypothetical protein [Gossypium klotzschianum]